MALGPPPAPQGVFHLRIFDRSKKGVEIVLVPRKMTSRQSRPKYSLRVIHGKPSRPLGSARRGLKSKRLLMLRSNLACSFGRPESFEESSFAPYIFSNSRYTAIGRTFIRNFFWRMQVLAKPQDLDFGVYSNSPKYNAHQSRTAALCKGM